VRHDLEGSFHFAATDLIVVQELNGSAVPAVGKTVLREGISLRPAGRHQFRCRGESPDNVSYASVTRNFSTCFVFLLLTEQFLFVVIGLQNACGLNAPPR